MCIAREREREGERARREPKTGERWRRPCGCQLLLARSCWHMSAQWGEPQHWNSSIARRRFLEGCKGGQQKAEAQTGPGRRRWWRKRQSGEWVTRGSSRVGVKEGRRREGGREQARRGEETERRTPAFSRKWGSHGAGGGRVARGPRERGFVERQSMRWSSPRGGPKNPLHLGCFALLFDFLWWSFQFFSRLVVPGSQAASVERWGAGSSTGDTNTSCKTMLLASCRTSLFGAEGNCCREHFPQGREHEADALAAPANELGGALGIARGTTHDGLMPAAAGWVGVGVRRTARRTARRVCNTRGTITEDVSTGREFSSSNSGQPKLNSDRTERIRRGAGRNEGGTSASDVGRCPKLHANTGLQDARQELAPRHKSGQQTLYGRNRSADTGISPTTDLGWDWRFGREWGLVHVRGAWRTDASNLTRNGLWLADVCSKVLSSAFARGTLPDRQLRPDCLFVVVSVEMDGEPCDSENRSEVVQRTTSNPWSTEPVCAGVGHCGSIRVGVASTVFGMDSSRNATGSSDSSRQLDCPPSWMHANCDSAKTSENRCEGECGHSWHQQDLAQNSQVSHRTKREVTWPRCGVPGHPGCSQWTQTGAARPKPIPQLPNHVHVRADFFFAVRVRRQSHQVQKLYRPLMSSERPGMWLIVPWPSGRTKDQRLCVAALARTLDVSFRTHAHFEDRSWGSLAQQRTAPKAERHTHCYRSPSWRGSSASVSQSWRTQWTKRRIRWRRSCWRDLIWRKWWQQRFRLTTRRSVCEVSHHGCLGTCFAPNENCTSQKCISFWVGGPSFFFTCCFPPFAARRFKGRVLGRESESGASLHFWGSGGPSGAGKCVVCVCGVACLWRLLWRVKCVLMTCFALSFWAVRLEVSGSL